ncbi:MAG: capsid protein [Gammaproteobacteria bacterium RIFCSPHIGHO2_12_FULL_63_22]|nr:MAG: capsid protein [Gammaproteobacteria bacterium RIFCSPHIGHO2_12_FULL_63_22]
MEPEVKEAVTGLMTAFEEFKATNDTRLKQIETKGTADPTTVDKLAKLEAKIAAYEPMGQKVTAVELQSKAAKDAADEVKTALDALTLKMQRPGAGGDNKRAELKAMVNTWVRGAVGAHTMGVANLPDDQRKALEDATAEYKSLNVSADTAGGYLAPIEFVAEIIKGETEISPARSLVRVRQTALKSIQIPKRTGQFAAVWVAEQGTRSETTGLAYGLEEIPTHEIYALIDISQQMLEDSAFDMEAEVRGESIEQFAVAEGAAIVSGNGVGKPQGFLAHPDLATTNSGAATTVTADGLLTLKHAIKTAYTRNANFVLNRTTLGSVRKLKDGNGQYLWMPGLASGKPNTIDGDPYVEMPDMPNEGAGAKCVAYGDFRRAYVLVDRIAMQMLRDPFTQATAGNIRFIMRRRIGGQMVLAEAVRALVCSA